MDEDFNIEPMGIDNEYWWVTTLDDKGSLYVLGWFPSEERARSYGLSKFNGRPFNVEPLKTRDRTRARDILKFKKFDTGELQLEEMGRRARYK